MNRFHHLLAVACLSLAGVLLSGQAANAGRLGGPAQEVGTIAPYQSVYFDIPFTLGPAVVSVAGNGPTNLGLYLYDGDGNVAVGSGLGNRQTVSMRVYRAGTFRVEIQNPGPIPAEVVVGTN